MTKTCIICGSRAGSGEHTFPAAFGGRRTNKGIYCRLHNNAFGRHIAALLRSLDIVNATIGVIPDRHDEVRPAPAVSGDGEQFLVSKEYIKIAPPAPLKETPELIGKKVVLAFADQPQITKWIAEQHNAGFDVKSESLGPVQSKIITGQLRANRVLGDEPFMRSLVYLSLTFLAHFFAEVARSPGVSSARNIIENDAPLEDRVWWERPCATNQLSTNPFIHGHTVAIAIDGQTQKITALVSLYGAIQLGVDLGEVSDTKTVRCTTHINPLALRPPNDIVALREEGLSLVLGSPEDGQRYLNDVLSGQARNPFERIFSEAGNDQNKDSFEGLLSELLASKALPQARRAEQVLFLLSQQHQRIFNLLREGIQRFERSNVDIPQGYHDTLKQFISRDDNSPRGITRMSEAALHVATAFLADEVRKRLDANSLNMNSLISLLSGSEGLGIVFGVISGIVFKESKA